MGDPANVRRDHRIHSRYTSDLTEEEWRRIEGIIPPARRGGNRRRVDMRNVVDGILYVLSTGCKWRAIPKDLPPRSTIFGYLTAWRRDGTLDRILQRLGDARSECVADRQLEKSDT